MHKQTRWFWLVWLFSLLSVTAACASPQPPPLPPTASPIAEAVVTPSPSPTPPQQSSGQPFFPTTISATIEETNGRLRLIATLQLDNDCQAITRIEQARQGRKLTVLIEAAETAETGCPPAARDIQETIDISVEGLAAGFYTFTVNDFAGSFPVDEPQLERMVIYATAEAEAQATVAAQATATAAAVATQEARAELGIGEIGGDVWHDECLSVPAVTQITTADESPPPPPEGCIRLENGAIVGDGLYQTSERGIPFVTVELRNGACPSLAVRATTQTDVNGRFLFRDVIPDSYCLTARNTNDNESLLAAGIWTSAGNTPRYAKTIELNSGDQLTDLSLGWDYATLPRADIAQGCINKGFYLFDVTYPPGETLAGGELVTKQWRVQNIGTCPWSPDYGLAYIRSDGTIDQDNIVSLNRTVLPNETGDVSMRIRLPERNGRYRWGYRLVDENGEIFGVGLAEDNPLWFDFTIETGQVTNDE